MSRAKGPAFLLVADEAGLRAEWKQALARHGQVRAFTSSDSAARELGSGRRWLAFVVATEADGRALIRFLSRLRRSSPRTPSLVITKEAPRSLEAFGDLGFRWLPEDAPASEARYFLGRALALEVTGNEYVASAVEALGRERALTVKQMELTALSTMDLDRDTLVEGLGVSGNTLKTRVRQLLAAFGEESMETLGKTVLWVALSNASRPSFGGIPGPRGTEMGLGALPSERGAELRPAPKPPRKRRSRRK